MSDFSNSEFLYTVVQGIRHAALAPIEKQQKGRTTGEADGQKSPRPSRVSRFFGLKQEEEEAENGGKEDDEAKSLEFFHGVKSSDLPPGFTLSDYVQYRRYSFTKGGGTKETVGRRSLASPPPPKVLMKDYCPSVFANIKHKCGVEAKDYADSWDLTKDECSMEEGAGRSGSLFLFSKDKKFLLKTVPRDEAVSLRLILPHYHRHNTSYPKNLLMKFFALHRFRAPGQPETFLIIANNLLHVPPPYFIHTVWDLKGRKPKPGKIPTAHKKNGQVLKDKDLNRVFRLPPLKRDKLLADIKRDTDFLCENNLMDYSFLIGTVGQPPEPEDVTIHIPSFEDESGEVPIHMGAEGDITTKAEEKELQNQNHQDSFEKREPPPFPGVKMHSVANQEEQSEEERKELKEGELKEQSFWSKVKPLRSTASSEDGESEGEKSENSEKEENKGEKERKKEVKLNMLPRERQRQLDSELSRHNSWLGSMDSASSLPTLPTSSSPSPLSLPTPPSPPSSLYPLLSSSNALYTMESANGKEVFYLGVIDFLAQYRFKKKSAHFFKSFLWRGESLSTVPASYYNSRLNFYLVHVIHADGDEESD